MENTAPAFRAAIDKGYGIECDLQPADDGTPMVFHDEKLDRLVAATGPSRQYSPATLARFRYKGRIEKILTFAQFLELVDGRVPLLVEVKGNNSGVDAAFLEKIARQARSLRGTYRADVVRPRHCHGAGRAGAEGSTRGIVGGRQVLASLWAGRSGTRERCRGLPRISDRPVAASASMLSM